MEFPKKYDIGKSKEVEKKEPSELATQVVDSVKKSYQHPQETKGGLIIDLKQPNVFVNMLKYTISKHDKNFIAIIHSGSNVVGYLGLEKKQLIKMAQIFYTVMLI